MVNPFGVMYNPVSILHTVKRCEEIPHVAVFTLGTNHVYILERDGRNREQLPKRPQRLFEERQLTINECGMFSRKPWKRCKHAMPMKIIVTVSPIRYAKYGFHGSQLSEVGIASRRRCWCKNIQNPCPISPPMIVNDELQ